MLGTAIGFSSVEGASLYLFLHATQSPFEAWFLRVVRDTEVVPVYRGMSDAESLAFVRAWRCQRFRVCPGEYLPYHMLPEFTVDEAFVIENLTFRSHSIVDGFCGPVPMKKWIELWAEPVVDDSGGHVAAPSAASVRDMLAAHPWAAQYAHRRVNANADEEEEEAVDPVDVLFARAVAFVDGAAPAAHAIAAAREWFFVRVRTDWGVLDSDEGAPTTVATEATKGVARSWCVRFRLNQSASFSIARLGLGDAFALAQEWRSRADCFFRLYLDADDTHFLYSDVELASYVATQAWTDFCASKAHASEAHTKCLMVEQLRPRNP
jgi:hypothetical protein